MRIGPIDLVDVFVYLVVLGLFIQLFPAVISDAVYLGGFFQVTALIIALMLARGGVRRLFPPAADSAAGAGDPSDHRQT